MTSTGHYLVGISLGIVSAIACGHYYDVGLRWLDIANGLNWIVATLLGQREDEIVLGVPVLLLFFGSLAGARAPDWLEFPMFFGRIRCSSRDLI
ncbi:MAG: hypothetical protein GY751_06620 [Bacteroidetes bacterium]|nr:hypothetical protein [Bacteroidota bacterium]